MKKKNLKNTENIEKRNNNISKSNSNKQNINNNLNVNKNLGKNTNNLKNNNIINSSNQNGIKSNSKTLNNSIKPYKNPNNVNQNVNSKKQNNNTKQNGNIKNQKNNVKVNNNQNNNIKSDNNQKIQNNNIKPDNNQKNLNNNIKPYKNQQSSNNNIKPAINQNNKNSKENIKKNTVNNNQNNLKNKGNSNSNKNKSNNNKSNNNKKNVNPQNNLKNFSSTKELKKNNNSKNIDNNKISEKIENSSSDKEKTENKIKSKSTSILIYIILIIIAIIAFFGGMFVYNIFGNKINKNVYIADIDVSNLEYSEVKEKLEKEYAKYLKEELYFVHNDNEYKIKLEDIDFSVLIEDAAIKARNVGRNENIILAIKEYYNSILGQAQKVDLEFDYNKEKLDSKIKEIENNFYKEVKQYSYIVEENKLKITPGEAGIKINQDKMVNILIDTVRNRKVENKIEIPIKIEEPEAINVEKIHSEVFVEVANAYYEKNPFKLHNEVIGVDFDKNELSELLELEPLKEQYIIDLKITEPQIKVNDLGLYNDVLGQCRTAYVNNPNRTTNLRLAASKINGKILMPGESFSYNEVVGERTVAAGYRNAAIYVNGEVEDGLAGGICQISSTLYDAVVYSNLQVDERFNHARVPSYVTAGRDATVYWGSKDFKFTNNREYPIKIEITVNAGYANAIIYGMKTDNEYEIAFASSVVSRYNGYMVVKTYKVYKQNGVEVKRELISTDSYKV